VPGRFVPTAGWRIDSGPEYCHITADNCIADDPGGSHAVEYGIDEACAFTFTGNAVVSNKVSAGSHMDTEYGYDEITVDGFHHSGLVPAEHPTAGWDVNVAGSKIFMWKSDHMVNYGGFKLCAQLSGTQPTPGDRTCHHCPHGSISTTYNAAACTVCPNGQYAVAPATVCTECAPGQYHAGSGESCTDCRAGSFAESAAATKCVHCPSGKFQDAAVYHECKSCEHGKWTPGVAAANEIPFIAASSLGHPTSTSSGHLTTDDDDEKWTTSFSFKKDFNHSGMTECVDTPYPTPYPTRYPTPYPTLYPTPFPTQPPWLTTATKYFSSTSSGYVSVTQTISNLAPSTIYRVTVDAVPTDYGTNKGNSNTGEWLKVLRDCANGLVGDRRKCHAYSVQTRKTAWLGCVCGCVRGCVAA
jgi:hypothetical protein